MPGNFRSAIFIFQNRLTAYRFRIKKKQAILQDQQEYSFVQQNLPQVFSKLKKSFHTNKFYLLLPETHTYLKLLEFPASTKLDRSLVLQKAQETIPEQIQEGYYDWKQFPLAKDESQLKVQFIAVSTDYLLPLQKAATQAGLSFPAFEPLSLALARLHQYEPKPQLISHEGAEGTTLLISHQSRVFASTVFSDLSQKNQEKTRLTDFVHTNWHLKPAKEIKAETFQAALGLVIKEDLKGKDAQTLNLAPTCPDPVPPPNSPPDPIPDLSSSSPLPTTPTSTLSKFSKFRPPSLPQLSRQFWFILLFTALFIAGLSWLVLKPHSADLLAPTGSSAPTQETPVPTQIPSPTPTPDLKLLKINLLNGAGTPGLANQVTVILENAGFEDIKTGNADNFDYDQTQIRIKQEKENYLSALVSALSDYPIASSTSALKEDDPFDAVIILGKEKE